MRHDSELLVCLRGPLDLATRAALVAGCRTWAADGVRDVLVDMSQLRAVNGLEVATLLRCRLVMRARGGSLRVVNPPARASAALTSTGICTSSRAKAQRVVA